MDRRHNIEYRRALRPEEVLAALNDVPSDQSEGGALSENADSDFEPESNSSDSCSGSELEEEPVQHTPQGKYPSDFVSSNTLLIELMLDQRFS